MAKRILSLALTLALVLSLAACGKTETPAATATAPPTEIPAAATVAPTETLEATTIRLEKLDGSGTLENEAGKALTILDGMQLFSGYTVGTQDESYAYLSLDAAKALKLDAVSSASVAQNEKAYEVTLKSGNIFFNITKPLTDEETLNITTSTLTIGIRGTSGVVRSDDTVYVLDGSVEVTYNGETYTVNAGEIATLADGVVTVAPLKEAEVGEFAIEELRADEALENRVREASDLKVDVLLGIVPPSVFDELGYTTISVATDGTYDYTTSTYDVVGQTIGQITFTGYEVFESDATHEAKEGYEWRAVHLNMFFNEDNASYYGVVYSFPSVDYYTGEFVGDELLLIYNGIEYNECLTQKERVPHPPEEVDYEYFQYEWDKYAVRVPIGYDGYTLMFYNGKYYWDPDTQTTADHSAWEYITDGQEVASDPDTLFFRFD